MSTLTVPAARSGARTARPRSPLTALARVESRRLLRSPVLLASGVLAAYASWSGWWDGREPAQDWGTQNYDALFLGAVPLYLAAFLVAGAAALRERGVTTAELFRTTPVPWADRTQALLLAGLVPAALAAVVALGEWALIRRAGGVTLGMPPDTAVVQPTLLEALHVPVLAFAAFCAAVALARTVRSRAVGAVLGTFGTVAFLLAEWAWQWFPAVLLAPADTALRRPVLGPEVDAAESARYSVLLPPDQYTPSWSGLERDLLLSGGHTLYLLGIAVVLAAYAVRRSGGDRRTRRGLAAGLVLAGAGLGLQLVALDGAYTWWRQV